MPPVLHLTSSHYFTAREEIEEDVIQRKAADELLISIVQPVKLKHIAELPAVSWQLESLRGSL